MLDDAEKEKTAKGRNLYDTLKKAYSRFLKIRGTPREIALGVALGLLVGMTPTMGIQTPIAIFIAALFKWNKISSAAGVWISNPFTAPILYPINYFVGAKILGLEAAQNLSMDSDVTIITKFIHKAPGALGAMTLGGIILGIPLAVIGYHVTYSAVKKYQKDIKEKLARKKTEILKKHKDPMETGEEDP